MWNARLPVWVPEKDGKGHVISLTWAVSDQGVCMAKVRCGEKVQLLMMVTDWKLQGLRGQKVSNLEF